MAQVFFIAALVCGAGVVLSLLWGLTAMARAQGKASQGTMRLRLALQGLAVLFLLASIILNR